MVKADQIDAGIQPASLNGSTTHSAPSEQRFSSKNG